MWEDSGRFVAPNGAVMRTSIIGVQDFSYIPTVLENTKAACHVTHADPRCLASCVAVTTAIALMLQGKHKNRDGSYDADALGREAFGFACDCLDQEEQVERNFRAGTAYTCITHRHTRVYINAQVRIQ